jgi:hypothetical protein
MDGSGLTEHHPRNDIQSTRNNIFVITANMAHDNNIFVITANMARESSA